MTISDIRKKGHSLLKNKTAGQFAKRFVLTPTPFLDIDCFLEYILQKDKTFITVHPDFELAPEQEKKFFSFIEQRRTGLPVAYITGHKEFYGLDFLVTPDVLIPKPDTETLVELALIEAEKETCLTEPGISLTDAHRKKAEGKNEDKPYRIADICTGSGCIAITMIHELINQQPVRKISMTASDISAKVLKIAKENARLSIPSALRSGPVTGQQKNSRRYDDSKSAQAADIRFFQGDLFDALPSGEQSFDMILSNPPYIPSSMVDTLLKDGRNEPRTALDGDTGSDCTDGLGIIHRLVPQAYRQLARRGVFFIETGEYNAIQTADLMQTTGFSDVHIHKDLSGQLRVTEGRKGC